MGKTIEIRLSDAQHAALTEAHQANPDGRPFYGFCRDMLMAGLTEPKPVLLRVAPQLSPGRSATVRVAATNAPAGKTADDRIARIEDAVARLTDYVMGSQQPSDPQPEQPIDVDSLVDAQFAEAEAQGLTHREPDENEEVMRHAGVRPLSRRPPRFSANSAPRHLQSL
jgi:hypothetical protein